MHCGLDIGTYSIKVIQAGKKGQGYTLEHWGEVLTPVSLQMTDKQSQMALAQTIKGLLKDAKVSTREVGVAIPEDQVYSRVIQLPYLSDAELASAIEYEAEQYIPFPVDQVQMEYFVLNRSQNEGANKTEVLLFAAKKKAIEGLVAILEMAGLVPLFVETEILALNRALVYPEVSLFVNIGRQSTSFAITNNGEIKFVYNFGVGGEALTRALMQTFSLDAAQAEEYKKAYGLNETLLEGKVSQALFPAFNQIVQQTQKTLNYYSQSNKDKENIKRLVLTGGTAQIPGIAAYMTKTVGVETVLGNPLATFIQDQNVAPQLLNNAPRLATAIGLAIRET